MFFTLLNSAFVGALLGYINFLSGYGIDSATFWLVMIAGSIVNATINMAR